jgi:glycosyltransferase involved in cell wall biosynthesis
MENINNPLVSVIICFLNEETFLAEAVDSVLEQDYTNWELFLVDDGSNDGSTAQARTYAQHNSGRITYVDHDGHANIGLSASRNVGIRRAKGPLLALLDADDVWLPNKLTQQVGIMQQHPEVALLCEASEYWSSWSDSTEPDQIKPVGAAPGRTYDPPQLLQTLYPFGRGAAPCPSGLMIRKEKLHGRFFEESFRGIYAMYEDQGFLTKMYLHEKVYVSGACNNRYRQRVGSLVQSVHGSGRYEQVRKFYLNWFENYLNQNNITDKQVRRSVWKAQLEYRYPFVHRMVKMFA